MYREDKCIHEYMAHALIILSLCMMTTGLVYGLLNNAFVPIKYTLEAHRVEKTIVLSTNTINNSVFGSRLGPNVW